MRGETLRRFILAFLLISAALILPGTALAQEVAPPWPQTVRDADLIVKARVVEGGRFGARVVAEETFFGDAPEGPFLVIGFSDGAFPPPILEEEALRNGELVYLFLRRWPREDGGFEIPHWLEEDWAPTREPTWTTGTPVAGDVPIRDGKVRVQLVFGGYHHLGEPMDIARWESLVRAMVDRFKHDRIDEEGLAAAASCLDAGVQSRREMPQGETVEAQCLAELWLRGEHRMDPRMEGYVHAPPMARGVLAGLAGRAGAKGYEKLIREVTLAPTIDAPAAMVAVGRDGGEDYLASVIAPMLPAARAAVAPEGTDLQTLRTEDSRSRILAALVDLHSEAQLDLLRDELQYLNPRALYVAIDAMDAAKSASWVSAVEPILAEGERRRTTAVLEAIEAHGTAEARDALHRFIARTDIDPGLRRLGVRVLGAVGDDSSAALLRTSLEGRLAFEGRWDDDRADEVGAELEALEHLTGAGAADLAWVVARQYLGLPKSYVNQDFRDKSLAEHAALEKAVLRVLPKDSSASVRVVTEREDAFESRGQRVVLVDAKASAGVTEQQRQEVARVAGTTPERVRLCGPDPRGRVRCLRSRGDFWEPHSRMLTPMLRAIGASAGLGERPAEHPEPIAGRWLAWTYVLGWAEPLGVAHVIRELWGPGYLGPVHPDHRPPLVPPGLEPFDASAPPR